MRGEGGVMRIVYEKHPNKWKELENTPFTDRFLPKGARIPTKRSAYSYQKPRTHKPHQHRPPCKKKASPQAKVKRRRDRKTPLPEEIRQQTCKRASTPYQKGYKKYPWKVISGPLSPKGTGKKTWMIEGGGGGHTDRVWKQPHTPGGEWKTPLHDPIRTKRGIYTDQKGYLFAQIRATIHDRDQPLNPLEHEGGGGHTVQTRKANVHRKGARKRRQSGTNQHKNVLLSNKSGTIRTSTT